MVGWARAPLPFAAMPLVPSVVVTVSSWLYIFYNCVSISLVDDDAVIWLESTATAALAK